MGHGAQPSLSWCPVPAAAARGPGNRSRPLERSAVALKASIYKRDLAHFEFLGAVLMGFCTYCQVRVFNALTLSAPLYIFMLCRRRCLAEEPLNILISFFYEQSVETVSFLVTEKDCLCQH